MAMPQERPAPILPHQGTAASSSADDLQRTSNSSEVTTSSQVSVPAPVRAPSPPPPPPPPPPEMDVAVPAQKSSKPPPIPVEQQCTSAPSTSLGAAEQSPRAKKHPLQSSETTEAEMRSRKSSSSSQRSSKSKRARKEELTREFENCLEQVGSQTLHMALKSQYLGF
ncbi:unnamed protein product [Nippostrongylus brasiliensis]|uniref:Vegetative cell wall protein gp1-like n=1 Tax=Nippostrongylus brasiliensis TaxID=27835 RepID=A0A0N4XK74_NIPBR|nr:unnamed protein product [Nippostrongylus brasiliensis]